MQFTSNEADKYIKRLREEISRIREIESQSNTFVVATTENIEDARPEYDFSSTQSRIEELQKKIRIVKHAINVFNTTTELPDLCMTIDVALVMLPQLNEVSKKLKYMSQRLPKRKVPSGNSALIQYEYENYDNAEVSVKSVEIDSLINKIQTTLDTVNNSVKFDVNID